MNIFISIYTSVNTRYFNFNHYFFEIQFVMIQIIISGFAFKKHHFYFNIDCSTQKNVPIGLINVR